MYNPPLPHSRQPDQRESQISALHSSAASRPKESFWVFVRSQVHGFHYPAHDSLVFPLINSALGSATKRWAECQSCCSWGNNKMPDWLYRLSLSQRQKWAVVLSSNDLLRGTAYSPGTAWFAHVRSQENVSVFEASTGSGVGQEGKRDKVADGATRAPHPRTPRTPHPIGPCGLT